MIQFIWPWDTWTPRLDVQCTRSPLFRVVKESHTCINSIVYLKILFHKKIKILKQPFFKKQFMIKICQCNLDATLSITFDYQGLLSIAVLWLWMPIMFVNIASNMMSLSFYDKIGTNISGCLLENALKGKINHKNSSFTSCISSCTNSDIKTGCAM